MDKPGIWLFDIDGTVALRQKDGRSPFDWNRVSEDTPNEPVIHAIQQMAWNGTQFIGMTGRLDIDECRKDTEQWISRHVFTMESTRRNFLGLFMRDIERQYIPDDLLKYNLYKEHIQPYYTVRGVFDDRDKVVAMWRRLGLTCFQVAEGNF